MCGNLPVNRHNPMLIGVQGFGALMVQGLGFRA